MNKMMQGQENRENVLWLLSITGYATTRQIAKCCWGRCDNSTRKMAGRTLRWLLNRSLIVSKRDGSGSVKVNNELLFALTAAGAEHARRNGDPLVAEKVHARDWLRHAHQHRTACNSVFSAWPSDVNIWTELQVRAKASPVYDFKYPVTFGPFAPENYDTKIPDLIAEGGNGQYEWIEVENSWRSEKDLIKMVQCMQAMFMHVEKFECVHFIVTVPGARTIGKRLKQKLMAVADSGEYRHIREVSARIIATHIRVSVLDPLTLTLSLVPLE